MKVNKHLSVKYLFDTVGFKYFKLKIYVYFIDGVLIDTGPAVRRRKFLPVFRDWNPNVCAITHLHDDHAGLASDLEKKFNIPIYLHHSSVKEASQEAIVLPYRRLFWGHRRGFHAQPFNKTIETTNNTFDIIETPGHRNDHIMLHEKNRGWLFTGDLYVAPKQRYAFIDDDISQHITSLEKVLKLDFDTIFCSHAGVKTESKNLVRQKLDFFYDVRENVRKYRKMGMNYKEISKILFPKRGPVWFISAGDWSGYHIVKTIDPD
jgi:ribonuclease/clavin/mitogillin